MARKRETYSERIARGLARGLTRSQARGHARPSERAIRPPKTAEVLDKRLTTALRVFRATDNATFAAKTGHVSPERFSRFLRDQGVAARQGRKWTITDNLVRETDAYIGGRHIIVRVRGFDAASTIAQHKAAVAQFIRRPDDLTPLAPFEGVTVTDTAGRQLLLDTRPNSILRLSASGGSVFETVYRILAQ
jgi:hypothetical protein